MFCPKCGREFKPEEKFCTQCGSAAPAQEAAEQVNEIIESIEEFDMATEEPIVEELPAEEPEAVPAPVAEATPVPTKTKKKMNIFAVIGFVVSIVCFFGIIKASVIGPLAGLIFSIVALVQIKKNNQKGKGLAIAGIILGSIATVVSFVSLIITAIFSYAVPGLFRLLLTYVFPELFAMLGDYVGDSVTEAMNSFWSNTGAELIESIKTWFESLFNK